MNTRFGDAAIPIQRLAISAYTIPTDAPESDGTYAWHSTTLVPVEATAGDRCGLRFTYIDTATARLIKDIVTIMSGSNTCCSTARSIPICSGQGWSWRSSAGLRRSMRCDTATLPEFVAGARQD